MTRDGIGVEEFNDGLGREVDSGDFLRDDTGDDAFAEGDEDDMAGL